MRTGRHGTHRIGGLALFAVLVPTAACQPEGVGIVESTVRSLVACPDLCDDDLEAVLALGDEALVELDRALGPPSPEDEAILRQRLAQAYRRSGFDNDPDPVPLSAYMDRFSENQVARRQLRAIVALDTIRLHGSGSSQAAEVLVAALEDHATGGREYRDDVVRELSRVVHLFTDFGFAGGAPTQAGLFDTIVVRGPPTEPFNGNELIRLPGGPFPDDVHLVNWRDSAAAVVVGGLGDHALLVDSLGPNEDRTEAHPFAVTSLVYSRGTPGAPAPLGAPVTGRAFSLLTSEAPDEYFELDPGMAASLRLVAGRSPFSDGSLGMILKPCGGFVPAATNLTITVVDARGDAVEGALVSVDGVGVGTTDAFGHFTVVGVTAGNHSVTATVLGRPAASAVLAAGSADGILVVPSTGGAAPEPPASDTIDVSLTAADCLTVRLHAYGVGDPIFARIRADADGADTEPPVIAVGPAPLGGSQGGASFTPSVGALVTDRGVLDSVWLNVRADGADASGGGDGNCQDSDYLLVAGQEIDRQDLELQNGTGRVDFSAAAAEGFDIPNPGPGPVRYCFTIGATDRGVDPSGLLVPNTSVIRLPVDVAWFDSTLPDIGPLDPGPVGSPGGTQASAHLLSIGAEVTDLTPLDLVRVNIRVDGTDAAGAGGNGVCEGTDHLLQVPAEVDQQNVDLQNGTSDVDFTGSNAVTFIVADPAPIAVGSIQVRYCLTIRARDQGVDAAGASDPNTRVLRVPVVIQWDP